MREPSVRRRLRAAAVDAKRPQVAAVAGGRALLELLRALTRGGRYAREAAVTVGAENSVSYLGLFEGQDYTPVPIDGGTGFFGNIEMRSWLVYSR